MIVAWAREKTGNIQGNNASSEVKFYFENELKSLDCPISVGKERASMDLSIVV